MASLLLYVAYLLKLMVVVVPAVASFPAIADVSSVDGIPDVAALLPMLLSC
jgi:hypothetical protein